MNFDDIDMTTPEGQAEVERRCRDFASITSEAHEMLPLLTQTFKVRLKRSTGLGFSVNKVGDAKYLGKWVEVRVNWAVCSSDNFVLQVVETRALLQFMPDFGEKHEAETYITQKGLAPKMYETWKLAFK